LARSDRRSDISDPVNGYDQSWTPAATSCMGALAHVGELFNGGRSKEKFGAGTGSSFVALTVIDLI
jgi:hypothetical protein